MRTLTWLASLLFLGLSLTTQSYAGGPRALEGESASDYHELAMLYKEQAQINKTKAMDWEFAADYYEKFPDSYTGKMEVSEHVASLRETAGDFRKAAEKDQELASKHRAMMRRGVGP